MATREKTCGPLRNWDDVKASFDRLALNELLDLDEPFTVHDVDAAGAGNPTSRLQSAVAMGVLATDDEVYVYRDDEHRRREITQYRFEPAVRKRLEAYRDERNELPCGHGAHVPPDGQTCKYCGREYDRETIREAMSQ